jgi:hypothetical protein
MTGTTWQALANAFRHNAIWQVLDNIAQHGLCLINLRKIPLLWISVSGRAPPAPPTYFNEKRRAYFKKGRTD